MAIFPVSLLPGEPPSAPPPPKPRQLKLPPRPPTPRDDSSDARPPPRPATSTSQPRRQTQASLANQRTVTRQQAERDARQASAERAQEQAEQAAVLPYAGQGGQSGQGGQGGGGGDQQRGRDDEPGSAAGAGRPDALEPAVDELDCHLLASLLPSGADDGIFEVLLPGGDKLGVAVDVGARSTSLLLMPSSERLRTQIKKKRMELENALERRMETQVRLTVL